MKENILKSVLAAILAAAAVYFRELLAPVIVMLIVMLIDYITGMAAAQGSSGSLKRSVICSPSLWPSSWTM